MTDIAVYLLPGMKVKLTTPHFYIGHGVRKIVRSDGTYIEAELKNGYMVADTKTGDIEIVPDEPAVIYTHKMYNQNKIVFFGRNPGETATVSVVAVPIHDHSSVVTGGPSHATYFTDDETVVNTDS